MQATITIDKELLTKAQEFLGLQDTSAVVDAALHALVQREASRARSPRWAEVGPTS